jgi:hypothetical protein
MYANRLQHSGGHRVDSSLGQRERRRRNRRKRISFELLEERRMLAPMTFTVSDPGDSGGAKTLRQAIINSNANDPGAGMSNTIAFNINSGPGPYNIQLLSALPSLTRSVLIDGCSQPGSQLNTQTNSDNAILQIALDGSAAGANVDGLTIAANSCEVRGLAIGHFTDAIRVMPNVTGTRIQGDFIGSNVTGTAISANYLGVNIMDGATSNLVGGPAPDLRNVISGNSYGIVIVGSNNQVQGNFIGTAVDGTSALANGYGVFVGQSATASSGNTLGGTAAGSLNVISGNTNYGVWIALATSTGNTVEGDFIGTTAKGDKPLANADGVVISDGASGNDIGTSAAGNTISGNSATGIEIRGAGTNGNHVGNNFVGVGPNTGPGLGNTDGIRIESGASNNVVGDQNARNTISGNSGAGVMIGGAGTGGNVVHGNYIGCTTGDIVAIPNFVGVEINGASSNVIGGLLAGGYFGNFISGNSEYGVEITGVGAGNNQVASNWIGLDFTGAAALPNGADGVWLGGGASGNTVGGYIQVNTTPIPAGNDISGNGGNGITIADATSQIDVLQGNQIGTDASGEKAVGNKLDGISLNGVSTQIGGTSATDKNVISANGTNGVEIATVGGFVPNSLLGNYIGTDATGQLALGNAADGILVDAGAQVDTVGGNAKGAGNVVSANGQSGVEIRGDSASSTITGNIVVQGNRIGTNAAGTSAMGNQDAGINVHGDGTNTVTQIVLGGSQAGAGNLVSGNYVGIEISGSGAAYIRIEGNNVGTDVTGTAPLANHVGVWVRDGASHNSIGGLVAGAGNTIAFNVFQGVDVGFAPNDASVGNSILSNSIFANNDTQFPAIVSGIYLVGSYATNNGPGPHGGPNHLQNYPVLISAVGHADGSTTLRGLLNSTPNTNYRVEFFANPAADPSEFGQGKTFLDATGVTTDANGNASFTVTLGFLPVGASLTSTATDLTTNVGDTSQFSNDIQVFNRMPTLASISPSAVVEGPTTLTVNGANFAADAVVMLNGTQLATTFVNPGQLQAVVPMALGEEGTDVVTVQNPGPEGGLSSGLPLTVYDAPPSATGLTVTAAEGGTFTGVVGTLSVAGGIEPTADYAILVNWGDGSSSQGTLAPADGGYQMLATHTYEEEGTYPTTIEILDDGATATVTGLANVADAALTAVGKSALFTEGVSASRTLATFEDADPRGAAGDYSATITWGDGQSSTGSIVADGGGFDVVGTHQYNEEANNLPISVTIQDAGGTTSTAAGSASIGLSTKGVSLTVTGTKQFTGTVATFSDLGLSPNNDFTATIAWGDSPISLPGTVKAGTGIGNYIVSGTHTYSSFLGSLAVVVTITDGAAT